jgi:hypothetical protein
MLGCAVCSIGASPASLDLLDTRILLPFDCRNQGGGAMRVSIEHKEEVKGLFRKTLAYFVTVTVQFSEAERAIINARGLQEKPIDISPGALASTVVDAIPNTLKLVGTIGMIVGFFATFLSKQYGWVAIFFFVGVGLLLYGISLERKWKKGEEDTLCIKDFLAAPVVIHAYSPLDAKLVDDHIRASLAGIKDVIESSETPLNKAGFEPTPPPAT